MNLNFEGKKVLVTGGTRGIGWAMTKAFLEAGARVSAAATQRGNLDSSSEFFEVDFSSLESTLYFIKNENLKEFDVLINNAGINKIDNLNDIKIEDWQKIQDVNLRGPFLTSQAVAQGMMKRKYGRILNIASIFGVVTKEKRLSYTTSKSGLIGMTKNLALELAPYNILVNAISPGFIDTELTRSILSEKDLQELVSRVPLKKLGDPVDIAGLALFLTSDLNRFMTGENLIVDGGFTCA